MVISNQWGFAQWGAVPWYGFAPPAPSTIVAIAVLPSRAAFGNGALTVSIASLYVLPSRAAFGNGALIQHSYLSVFLEGVDVSEKVLVGSVQITNPLSQPATASFALWDITGTIVPQVGQDIQIYLKTLRIFGGQVQQPFQTAFQAFPGLLYQGSGGGSSGGTQSATGSAGAGASGSGGVQCTDYTNFLNRFYVGVYFDGQSIFPAPTFLADIVAYIVETYLSGDGFTYEDSDGDPGINLGPTLFNWITVTAAFNNLSSITGWEWSVDYYKVIRFYPSTAGSGSAPFNIADNDGNVYAESLGVEYFQQQYRNVQGIISPTGTSALYSDTYSAAQPGPFANNPQPPDGIRRNFLQSYGFTAVPTVTVNGSPQVVAELLTAGGFSPPSYQWYIVQPASGLPSFGLFQNTADAPIGSSDVLVISYNIPLSPIYWVSNPSQILARQAIEGGSGIYQEVEQAPSVTDPNAIAAYAAGLLARYGDGIPFQVTYSTRNQAGLFAGQLQKIQIANPPLNFTGLLVQVTWQDVDGQFMQLGITVASGQYQGNFSFSQFMAALIAQTNMAQPSAFQTYQQLVAPSFPGITNPGVTGGNYLATQLNIQHAVELAYSFSVYLKNPVTGSQMEFQLLNVTQGLVVILQVFFQVGQSGTQTAYRPNSDPFVCYQGDVLEVLVGGSGGAILDGVCTLVTSVAVT